MQLAPHLHRVGSDIVSLYLIEDERGVTVIDAGLPGLWPALIEELTAMRRTLRDIGGLILTHGDSDHVGFAERLRREAGVPIFIHAADAPQALGHVKVKNPSWGPMKLGPLLSFLWYAGRRGGISVKPVSEVTTVSGGEQLELPGDPRIIHMPGHSPGSIAIHSAPVGAVFVGDALTTRHVLTGAEGPQPAPFTLDPDMAMTSLDNLSQLEARWVLPGHGPPWDGGVDEAVIRARAAAG